MRAGTHSRIVLVLWIAFGTAGCATIRDTAEEMESGTSRIVSVSPDSAWAAVVSVMQDYPTQESDKARGVLVTRWAEQLVEPDTFSQHRVLKERTRFELAIAARDGGSRIRVRHAVVELLAPVYADPVSTGQQALCQYQLPEDILGPGQQASSLYDTSVCVPDNPWARPQGSPMYVWRRISQVEDAPATRSSERENEILEAIEATVSRRKDRDDGQPAL